MRKIRFFMNYFCRYEYFRWFFVNSFFAIIMRRIGVTWYRLALINHSGWFQINTTYLSILINFININLIMVFLNIMSFNIKNFLVISLYIFILKTSCFIFFYFFNKYFFFCTILFFFNNNIYLIIFILIFNFTKIIIAKRFRLNKISFILKFFKYMRLFLLWFIIVIFWNWI